MQIKMVALDELTPDPGNVRKHSGRNVEAIAASLKRFGQQKPIVVDGTGTVRAGSGTVAAARQLGWTELATVHSDLLDDEARAYAIADNRTAELASWSADLAPELQRLADSGMDLIDVGFDAAELDELLKVPIVSPEGPPVQAENEMRSFTFSVGSATGEMVDETFARWRKRLPGDSTDSEIFAAIIEGAC